MSSMTSSALRCARRLRRRAADAPAQANQVTLGVCRVNESWHRITDSAVVKASVLVEERHYSFRILRRPPS